MYMVTYNGKPLAWFYTWVEAELFCNLWEKHYITARLDIRECTRWGFIKKVVFGK